jgi:hypothetical protein
LFAAILISAALCHAVSRWIGLPTGTATYRRIGPEEGPQVFAAGSSLLMFGLSWTSVSEAVHQGIENWGVGGSSPSEWEHFQKLSTRSNITIIGVSAYDLNEYHLCDVRADIVPIAQTVSDVRDSRPDWELSERLLGQYPLAYVRRAFPTAGRADAVLVGVRREIRERLKMASAADDQAVAAVLPDKPTLTFGDDNEKISDWSAATALRRMALLRAHIQGRHSFIGPKRLALRRMLARARGRVLLVVLPVSPFYAREFLTAPVAESFEATLAAVVEAAPNAETIRLDRVERLQSDSYYSDFVHLNARGRDIATETFLGRLTRGDATQRAGADALWTHRAPVAAAIR